MSYSVLISANCLGVFRVSIFYNIASCVLNNNCASKLFLLERGVRQACPFLVFSVTFIIATEVVAHTHTILYFGIHQFAISARK